MSGESVVDEGFCGAAHGKLIGVPFLLISIFILPVINHIVGDCLAIAGYLGACGVPALRLYHLTVFLGLVIEVAVLRRKFHATQFGIRRNGSYLAHLLSLISNNDRDDVVEFRECFAGDGIIDDITDGWILSILLILFHRQ